MAFDTSLLKRSRAGACSRPTAMDIVCAYISLTTGKCKKTGAAEMFKNDSDVSEMPPFTQESLFLSPFLTLIKVKFPQTVHLV